MTSNIKGALFLARFTPGIIFKSSLTDNFYPYRLSIPTKWKIFLVLLRVVFVFEKNKNKAFQNGFFLMKMLYIKRML